MFSEESVGNDAGKHNFNVLNLEANICNLQGILLDPQKPGFQSADHYLNRLTPLQQFGLTPRYDNASTVVRGLSAYWGLHDFTLVYPNNLTTTESAAVVYATINTPITQLKAMTLSYLNQSFSASRFIEGATANICIFLYNTEADPQHLQQLLKQTSDGNFSYTNRTVNVKVTRDSVYIVEGKTFQYKNVGGQWVFNKILQGPITPTDYPAVTNNNTITPLVSTTPNIYTTETTTQTLTSTIKTTVQTSTTPTLTSVTTTTLTPAGSSITITTTDSSGKTVSTTNTIPTISIISPSAVYLDIKESVFNYSVESSLKKILGTSFLSDTKCDVFVNVYPNIIIGSSDATNPSFTTGSLPSKYTVYLNNNGSIVGAGGKGGNGQNTRNLIVKIGLGLNDGQKGGTAIRAISTLVISNSGRICGGGGGGAGGNNIVYPDLPFHLGPNHIATVDGDIYFGGGGGGGAGSVPGKGGSNGIVTAGYNSKLTAEKQTPAKNSDNRIYAYDGTSLLGGKGVVGKKPTLDSYTTDRDMDYALYQNVGFDGGDLGQSGVGIESWPAYLQNPTFVFPKPGEAGDYIEGKQNVSWINLGEVKGLSSDLRAYTITSSTSSSVTNPNSNQTSVTTSLPTSLTLTISSNTNNYSVENVLKKNYNITSSNSYKTSVTVNVLSGVIVGSTNSLAPAFTTGSLNPNISVNLIVNEGAIIVGAGGNGGDGVDAIDAIKNGMDYGFYAGERYQGKDGGTAIQALTNMTVENYGYICGGGGGGGGGWPYQDVVYSGYVNNQAWGGGGGGGAGYVSGTGGARGLTIFDPKKHLYSQQIKSGRDGGIFNDTKTLLTAGGGIAGAGWRGWNDPVPDGNGGISHFVEDGGGLGGNGGAVGQPGKVSPGFDRGIYTVRGTSLATGNYQPNVIFTGGLAGAYIDGNHFINWKNLGNVLGRAI